MIKDKVRIAKKIADAGLCSRRDAEKLIENKKVTLNGELVLSPAINVSNKDEIKVNGKLISQNIEPKIWIFHKPKGIITTHKDTHNRKTVFDVLPKNLGHVISVGRLDINSEGLLLITNFGNIAHFLEHPKTAFKRKYKARIYGNIEKEEISKIEKGIKIDGIKYKPAKVKIINNENRNSWIEIEITEGKNREIRKIFEYFNYPVNRLIRISYGPFSLMNLKPGEIIEAPKNLVENIIKQMGKK